MVKGKNKNRRRRGFPVREVSQFSLNDNEARRRIAEKAYELYERRGFCHGCDLDDWLEAERLLLAEIDAQTAKGGDKIELTAKGQACVA